MSISQLTPGQRKLERNRTATLPASDVIKAQACLPSNDKDLTATSQRQVRRGRVRVPDWVVDDGSAPSLKLKGSTVNSAQCSPIMETRLPPRRSLGAFELGRSDSTTDRIQEDNLTRRLRALKQERDAAWSDVAAARDCAAQRSAELNAEAAKLRSCARTLQGELDAARQEALSWQCRRADVHDSGEALAQHVAHACELQFFFGARNDQSENFHRQALESETLRLRVESLSDELARQLATRKEIEEKLTEKCVQIDLLQFQLAILDNEAAASKSPWHRAPHVDNVPALNSTGNEESYHLDGSFDSTQLEAPVTGRDAVGHDLEFAYEWGLQLSGQMSVKRVLSLARLASQVAKRQDEIPLSRPPPANVFPDAVASATSGTAATANADAKRLFLDNGMVLNLEGPLAELQGALQVLQEASAFQQKTSQRTPSVECFDTFDQPIADLQRVLDNLQEAPSAQRQSTRYSGDAAAVIDDARDLRDFEAPIENLQQVLLQLGQPAEANGVWHRPPQTRQEALAPVPEASGYLEPEAVPPVLEPHLFRPLAGLAALSTPGEALIRQKFNAQRIAGV
mmetsp:Transcript_23897/g.66426  ORF Transcript_23897/g.66426 Transcript_23897/m.66426 type:complete len:570 (-) Transcript_23897:66-1775(-)|eukprot:CAMPEP_0117578082 /NCGR_PEP_ID=MMETSP0784-20121206/63796_1 /TAXON_ID=39447 /ORGANISM="" /LENGTH=569 /DNA_ID=CAMNT_0005377687 /DNA_START=81 /DNA_END=1790 /DNA_ORIENTATION=-